MNNYFTKDVNDNFSKLAWSKWYATLASKGTRTLRFWKRAMRPDTVCYKQADWTTDEKEWFSGIEPELTITYNYMQRLAGKSVYVLRQSPSLM